MKPILLGILLFTLSALFSQNDKGTFFVRKLNEGEQFFGVSYFDGSDSAMFIGQNNRPYLTRYSRIKNIRRRYKRSDKKVSRLISKKLYLPNKYKRKLAYKEAIVEFTVDTNNSIADINIRANTNMPDRVLKELRNSINKLNGFTPGKISGRPLTMRHPALKIKI